jgi:alanyl aminopeptidase
MRTLLLVILAALTGCSSANTGTEVRELPPEATEALEDTAPLGQLPRDVTPSSYEITLTVVPSEERFSGKAKIAVTLAQARSVLWLHGESMNVRSATITPENGSAIEARWEEVGPDGVAALRPAQAVPAGAATIEIEYDAPFDRQLNGLYRVDVNGDSYAFTQFEAIAARKAFPCFDEPRFKTPFDVTLVVRSEHVAATNTPVAEETPAENGMKRVHFRPSEPMPTYLVAFAVGPLDVVEAPPIAPNEIRSRPLPFRGIAARGNGERLAYALRETPKMLEWLERYFGIEYPYAKLDIVAVPDFNSGAMENVGLVTFREWLLLVDEARASESQKRAFASVMAHELAHMWFGNLVTMPWWDDIWLNEAFATWMASKVVRDVYPDNEASISHVEGAFGAMRSDMLASARQIRQPIESNHDIRNAFDRITYSKGGAVLEMFERWMGEETFRDALRHHMREHRFGVANADDLLVSLSTVAERDVGTPFRTFLTQPGVPFIQARVECDGTRRLVLSQSRYFPVGSTGERSRVWQIPICARYESDGEVRESCTLLTEAEGELAFEGETCPSWVMPNADASGYFRFALAAPDLEALHTRGYRQLTVRERIALADSLGAAWETDATDAADLFPLLEELARDEARQVATAPMRTLSFIDENVADDALRPRLRGYATRLYQARARELGFGPRRGQTEPASRALLRSSIIGFLTQTARDARTRREAARLGRAYVGYGGDGEIHPEVVDPNLLAIVLEVAVQDGDAAFFDHVLANLVATDDAAIRGPLLSALSSTESSELAPRALALALDERLRANEVMDPLWSLASSRHTREAAWTWFGANFDALSARVPEGRMGSSPWIAASFCSEDDRTRVETFFAPRIEALPGGPRNLAGALEAIHLCTSVVNAQGESARSYLMRQRP